MKGSKLHSAFVRRREVEQSKIEKNVAVDKYFDKWGKITSRFEQWAGPQYYKHADEIKKRRELEKIENEALQIRREKLKKLLDDEKIEHEMMLKDLNQPRAKNVPSSTLANIHETIKRTEEEKRRLELESRLYKKWRNGFVQDSVLLDSKTDHQALAKMNWLDKQVADQLERDQEKRCSEERQLRLQEEARKHEECLLQRKSLRDEEINDLKSFQTEHINEIKDRQKESDDLRSEELRLTQRKADITTEFEKLNLNARERKSRISCPYNVRRIKMILRQRSDAIRQDLKDDIDMLNRISIGVKGEQIELLKDKFELYYDMEIQKQTQIEAMYESEAKHLLLQQEELWNQEAEGREKLLKKLISEQLKNIDDGIEFNLKRQRELIEIKEKHLSAIEDSSKRLKELLNEQSKDDSRSSSSLSNCHIADTSKNLEHLQIAGPPKFGRKKIAWN
ncbi:hypothetical protein Bhyg_15155 [Pseudolycoriella hygida]|uniref:Trichoplein keratin filament-binding protein n=1 Tax=Pseudolycoriella hygida TaxID=35572 RepID=A0A9Q0MS05_9DIPT|nr:hypothetical protein Bhyg_15155 [Pseudolycoriella hygida]